MSEVQDSTLEESASDDVASDDKQSRGEELIQVRDLRKTFRIGLLGRRVEAVKGVSFEVRRGEIFGFLGPNGAGKTTTIKMLTGLIKPTAGEAFLFGARVPSAEARRRIGFLPENPYVYPYLTPREFVSLCGRLSGLSGKTLADRAASMLGKVGIAYAADRPVRRLSKGMLQRTGLAAALVSDPELLILDEPMSGLDPVGRKEVRDIILEERSSGRTIFFSTHILSDVETMCDRVTILREGKAVVSGALRKLLRGDVLRTDITLAGVSDSLRRVFEESGYRVEPRADVVVVEIEGEKQVGDALRAALDAGAQVIEVAPRRETLEDLFLRRAL
ncbi:MAG: ABC transporter ATP-binding protein [Polyangiaceae bacterium]|nr:ABC transporter ATP-binding protein [Polyangiaceae bacterium]